MVHVATEIYMSLADAIREGQNGYWEDGLFSAEILSEVEYVRIYTGVEFMGDRESYMEPVILKWDVLDFAFGDGYELTDFDKKILEKYI